MQLYARDERAAAKLLAQRGCDALTLGVRGAQPGRPVAGVRQDADAE